MGISNILGAASSYAKMGTGLLKNPAHLLGKSKALSFLSGTTLSKAKGRGDPLLSCFWDIELPDVPYWAEEGWGSSILDMGDNFLTYAGSLSSKIKAVSNAVHSTVDKLNKAATGKSIKQAEPVVQLKSEYVESVTLPSLSYGTDNQYRAGINYKFPNQTVEVSEFSMVLYADESCKSLAYIQNWLHLVGGAIDPGTHQYTGLWRCPNEYKKSIAVNVLDVNDNCIYTCNMHGVFPTSMGEMELGADGDRITYTATFSVDEVYFDGFTYTSNGIGTDTLNNIAGGFVKQGLDAVGVSKFIGK